MAYHLWVPKFLKFLLRSEAPPDEVVRVGLKGWLFVAGVFLVGVLVISSIQFQSSDMVGADAYYHTRVAKIISEQGILHEFPWTQASVFKEHYADKQFLFHVLLIPFLGSDLTFGPKVLVVILGALLLAMLAWILIRHGLPVPWLFVILLIGAGGMFFFRLSLVRPHLLAIPFSLLGAHLMLRRNVWGTFLLALIFPLCYTAAHLLVCLVLLYGLACKLHKEPFPWRLVVAVLVGTMVGLALHPHRANTIHLWYIQNIEVVLNASRIPTMGFEFKPPSGRIILWDTTVALFGMLGVACLFVLQKTKASLRTLFLLLATCGFFVLFLHIARFIEYWVPFALLFAASGIKDLLADFDGREFVRRHRILCPSLLGIGVLLLAAQTTHAVLDAQYVVRTDRSLYYRGAANWIKDNVAPKQTVFTCNWDSFPYLIHFAPEQYYLVTLDPTFMQAYDLDLFKTWRSIASGKEPDAAYLIPQRFGTRIVFAERRKWIQPFVRSAKRDHRFFLVYEEPDATVFVVPPDGMPLANSLGSVGMAALVQGAYFGLPIQTDYGDQER
ncbi:MAG: hypothetical protein JRJ19_08555 [Deltaproteobacteria bacterium]|nr:hypothetical protein [Deltaproteobacteria bacterium]